MRRKHVLDYHVCNRNKRNAALPVTVPVSVPMVAVVLVLTCRDDFRLAPPSARIGNAASPMPVVG